MPIYEYACPKCGEFERSQSIRDEPLKRCPTCKSKVTKLISSTAFQLKGGGWYTEGYQKKGATPAATPSSSEGSSSTPASPAAAPASSTPAPSTPATTGS